MMNLRAFFPVNSFRPSVALIYINQSLVLLCKTYSWFPYETQHRAEMDQCGFYKRNISLANMQPEIREKRMFSQN